jgi:phospholipid/cholesterol/gamma-HCH transport system substrate-binding protein
MPSRQKKITARDLRVGIFVLGALLIAGFLIINSSGSFNPFEKKVQLRVRFESADGLHAGGNVQLAGVSIGKVDDVNLLPPDSPEGQRIEAILTVSPDLDKKPIQELIRTDSKAQLVATSILGNDKMINITPGTIKGSPIEENALLESTAGNSLNQLTETGNDLLKKINELSVPAKDILNKANNGEGTLGRVINDEALYESLDSAVKDTRATMVRLQTTVDRINQGKGSAGKLLNDPTLYNNLNKTVAQLEAISADIKAGRGTAGKFVTDEALYAETKGAVTELRKSAEKISLIADDVKLITGDIREGRGSAGKIFRDDKLYDDTREAITRFGNTTARLESLIADAQAGKGTIGRLITDETLYNNISATANNVATFTGEGTKLLYDFRQNPKKFLRIKLSLF